MDLSTAYELLDEIADEGILESHSRGYEWMRDELMPAIALVEGDASPNEELLSDAWYIVGDIHDFNDAPLAAIEAYRKSTEADPRSAASFRELAIMHARIGEYESALDTINQALEIDNEVPHGFDDLASIQQAAEQGEELMFVQGDLIWAASEALGRFDPAAGLAALGEAQTAAELQALARCVGALAQTDHYLGLWEQISATGEPIELAYADWFFMADGAYDDVRFWQTLRGLHERMEPGVFLHPPEEVRDAHRSLTGPESELLLIDYCICRLEGDIQGLQAILARYPEWTDISDDIAELQA